MNLKEVSTADLVSKLAKRAEHFDALVSLAQETGGTSSAKSEVSTADLVSELARRIERFDALVSLALETGGTSTKPAKFTEETASKTVRSRRKLCLTTEAVFETLKAADRPLTLRELHKRIGRGTSDALCNHLTKLFNEQRIARLGKSRPFAYQVIIQQNGNS